MSELTLVGLHDDGEHVILEGPDGQQFRVRIDEALRAAVRRDRPHLEQVRAEVAGVLPPREIQSRIRAGASAEDVAESSGMPLEIVRRYEGPVLAEREYIAELARGTRIGHDVGGPSLGDLVTDRLATRDVAPESVRWDAYRTGATVWAIELHFTATDTERSARWRYDTADRRLHAQDDEARWLSETELADEPIRRHLTAVRDAVFDVEVDGALRPLLAAVDLPLDAPPADPDAATHALLDDLTGRRGIRQAVDLADPDDEDFAGFGPQHAFDFDSPDHGHIPGAHPPASRPAEAVDAQVLTMPSARHEQAADTGSDPHDAATESARRAGPSAPQPKSTEPGGSERPPSRRQRRGRASVPSWDEIVFGAKPE